MRKTIGLVCCWGVYGNVAWAAMQLAPPVRTVQEAHAYYQTLTAQNPWILASGRVTQAGIMELMAKEQVLIARLQNNSDFVREAKNRPDARKYRIRSFQHGFAER